LVPKTCLVTGASSGIGFQMALNLSSYKCLLLLPCRTTEKAQETERRIKAVYPYALIQTYVCDLSEQSSIHTFCEQIIKEHHRLDVLIHNAGCVSSTLQWTSDGIELQFAVNQLAPFLMNHMLLPLLNASENGRIIHVNSRAHARGTLYFDDLFLQQKYALSKAYNQSKLANMLYTYRLADLLSSTNVTVNAFHPGLVNTDFGVKNVNAVHKFMWQLMRILGRTPHQAAEDGLYLALSPDVKHITGKYYHRQQQIVSSTKSLNRLWQQKVWDICTKMTHIPSTEYGQVP